MYMKTIYKLILLSAPMVGLTACSDSFLDKLPDNRAEIDTEDKVVSLLGSAYPDHDFNMFTEMMSDNVDDMGEEKIYTDRVVEEFYYWKDAIETNNESAENYWQASYGAISSANQALDAIERIAEEKGMTSKLQTARAEALLCRAYNHFMLLNVFAKHYNPATAESDPGITYMTEPETTLKPEYERNTVEECYRLIDEDITKAIPDINDSYMKVPKYHFNPSAAYAFACRFYLYYNKLDKAIAFANMVLGANPKPLLRNYQELGSMVQDPAAVSQAYVEPTLNCNLLLTTGYSQMGRVFLNYSTWKRFAHSPYLDDFETSKPAMPWGTATYYSAMKSYTGTNYYRIFWRMPSYFEYKDPVAGTGYRHSIFVNFSTDEVLLNRAECYILKKDYDKACADINLWLNNIAQTTTGGDITPAKCEAFWNGIKYYAWNESTPKKHLSPAFEIEEEGSMQECMLHTLLQARRIEQLHTGMRWFDVKRYGIKIYRRVMDLGGDPVKLVDSLDVDDPRRAVQIPLKVRDAGYDANDRKPIVNQLESIDDDPKEDPCEETENANS